jgi:hypothetical protein
LNFRALSLDSVVEQGYIVKSRFFNINFIFNDRILGGQHAVPADAHIISHYRRFCFFIALKVPREIGGIYGIGSARFILRERIAVLRESRYRLINSIAPQNIIYFITGKPALLRSIINVKRGGFILRRRNCDTLRKQCKNKQK